MRKSGYIFILAIMIMAVIPSCKSQFEILLSSNDVDAKYAEANRLFNTGKYKKAAQMYESLSMLTAGMPQDDTVRYYWAYCNYKDQDYLTAKSNFDSFIDMYPRSPFTSDARFLKLDCLYRATNRYELDQSPTHTAIIEISQYILEFPQSDKIQVCKDMLQELTVRLDTKEYENARLYYKMEDYIAAKTAFKNVLKDKAENMYREDILYYVAMSAYKYAFLSVVAKQKERYMIFVDEYYNFVSEYPESHYKKELDNLYQRTQRTLGNNVIQLSEKELRKQERRDRKEDKAIMKH